MQQKTHDFLVRMRVPMATFGGDLMGEAIDFAIQEMRNNRFVTLTDIENQHQDQIDAFKKGRLVIVEDANYLVPVAFGATGVITVVTGETVKTQAWAASAEK